MQNSDQDTGQKPVGDGEYEVQQGDCVESIAARYGHLWKTIWDHPKNAAVKSERRDPNVLLPGDRLHIPPLRIRELSKGSDSRHSFTRLGVPSKLVLKLAEWASHAQMSRSKRSLTEARSSMARPTAKG